VSLRAGAGRAPAAITRPLLVLFLLAGCGGPAPRRATGDLARAVEASLDSGRERFEHHEWDRLLAGGARDGLVDYRFMGERRAELDGYLARVSGARIDRLAPGHLEALLINAYNALTVRSILDHQGVASIREIPGVWSAATHRVGGFELTLDDIEHRILRPFFRDPRVHFALNCASRSCAPLPPWAFAGDRIEEQLEERARAFLADPKNVRVEGGRLRLSRYFDWYGDDFVAPGWRGAAPSIAAFVAAYAAPEVRRFIAERGGKPPIEFIEYDWSLNSSPADPAP
jgi:hypothetical protein